MEHTLHPPLLWHPLEGERNLPLRKMCNIKSWATCLRDSCGCVSFPLVPFQKKQPCAACLFAHFLSLSLSLSCTHMPKFVACIAAFIARKVNAPKPVWSKWRLSDSFSYFPNFRFPLSCFLQIMNYSFFFSFLCSHFTAHFPHYFSQPFVVIDIDVFPCLGAPKIKRTRNKNSKTFQLSGY